VRNEPSGMGEPGLAICRLIQPSPAAKASDPPEGRANISMIKNGPMLKSGFVKK